MKTSNKTWRTKAACRDKNPDHWFPIGIVFENENPTKTAIATCLNCPVIQACAWQVLNTLKSDKPIRDGIWAGIVLSGKNGKQLETAYQQLAQMAGTTLQEVLQP